VLEVHALSKRVNLGVKLQIVAESSLKCTGIFNLADVERIQVLFAFAL
jgi:hypothetical protein